MMKAVLLILPRGTGVKGWQKGKLIHENNDKEDVPNIWSMLSYLYSDDF